MTRHRIYGRLDVFEGYRRELLPDKSAFCLVDDRDDPIWFGCQLCHRPYVHWLIIDRVWHTLPDDLQKAFLCEDCFCAIRGYTKFRSKARRREVRL